MTSITQLLSPWPLTKHAIVLREEEIPPNSLSDPLNNMQQSSPPSPNDPNNTDGPGGSAESDNGENTSDGRKGYGKRELSTSKRAAQNRAAQRAFRQRKEGYIKKLEEQVRDYQVLSENYKAVQGENYQLRDYIINLQSRLLESQGEVPPPPSNVDGLQPAKPTQPSQSTATLPRLSELGAVSQPIPPKLQQPQLHHQKHQQNHDTLSPTHRDHHQRDGYSNSTYPESPSAKRIRSSPTEMTPSQAALQGPSILSHSSAGAQ